MTNPSQQSNNQAENDKRISLWAYLKAFGMLVAVAAGWLLLSHSEISSNFDNYDWVNNRIQQAGIYGPIVFILLSGLGTVIGVPRLLVSAVAGFAFDLVPALAIALLSTLLGCMISFYYSRLMGRSIIRDIMPLRIKNYEKLLVEHDFLAGIFIRAIPISNNSIVNLLAGVTDVRPLHYFAGSAIGYVPLTVVFVLAGSGFQQGIFTRILLSMAIYLFFVIPVGYIAHKKIRSMTRKTDHE